MCPRRTKGERRSKPTANNKDRSKPKTVVVQEALQRLLDAKGNARRDKVLAAAQTEKSVITKFDLGNGLRILVKNAKVRLLTRPRSLTDQRFDSEEEGRTRLEKSRLAQATISS